MYRSNSNPYTIFITITFAEVNWVSHPFVKDSIVKKKNLEVIWVGTLKCEKCTKKRLLMTKNTLYLYKIIYVLCKLLKSDAIFIGESNWNEPQDKF